jgi:hypothetical protein
MFRPTCKSSYGATVVLQLKEKHFELQLQSETFKTICHIASAAKLSVSSKYNNQLLLQAPSPLSVLLPSKKKQPNSPFSSVDSIYYGCQAGYFAASDCIQRPGVSSRLLSEREVCQQRLPVQTRCVTAVLKLSCYNCFLKQPAKAPSARLYIEMICLTSQCKCVPLISFMFVGWQGEACDTLRLSPILYNSGYFNQSCVLRDSLTI